MFFISLMGDRDRLRPSLCSLVPFESLSLFSFLMWMEGLSRKSELFALLLLLGEAGAVAGGVVGTAVA